MSPEASVQLSKVQSPGRAMALDDSSGLLVGVWLLGDKSS